MKRLAGALDEATQILSATSDTPRLDAELLMADALGIDRDRLLLDPPGRAPPARFAEMVRRRAAGEPVAYITGRRAFWDIEVHVGPGALVPRPDSETLIAAAIEYFGDRQEKPRRILDLGTGPGTLLLAALDIWRDATGVGVDKSRRALSYAAANARRLGFEERADLRVGDWAAGIDERFDLILCNPPYVRTGDEVGPGVREFEPAEALFAGAEGLDAYRALAPELPRLLATDGLAVVEIGFDQADAAAEVLARNGLRSRVATDLGDRPRALLLDWAARK